MHTPLSITPPALRRRSRLIGAGVAMSLGLLGPACSLDAVDVGQNNDRPSFEEFKANTYQEPWEGGVFILNGDTPVIDDKGLEEAYLALYGDGALIVHQAGGVDAKWTNAQKQNLTYCVDNGFGSLKASVVAAMNEATGAWEAVADVNFIHATAEDARCNAANQNVVFDVRLVRDQPYLARAFFPNQPRAQRNVLIDQSSFGGGLGAITLTGILRHELGHVLGFRHEHTRPEAGTCFEDNNWRPLTGYDSASVMHYPQCNGTGVDLSITDSDAQGAEGLYGTPGTGGGEEPPPPTGSTPQEGSAQGQLTLNQELRYNPIEVSPGTRFQVQMTGTGDADLYVRLGASPSRLAFDCRPYLNGSTEACDLDVPAGVTQAFIMVHGFTSATFELRASWTGPTAP